MNQILDYNPNIGQNKHSGGSDNIVRVFAIVLIIFAIVLIAVVVYGKVSNKKEVTNLAQETTKADIQVTTTESTATITVTHDKNIEKLIYSWNSGKEMVEKGDGTSMQKSLDIPAGDNTLNIKVIDVNGVETTHEEQISAEQGTDIICPVIELSPLEGSKWNIKATDETAMDFITYRWNEDEEQTIYANENEKEINVEIEIPKGKNDLTVVAVDASNNISNELKSFTGITKPTITPILSEDATSISFVITHENGVESVGLNFNGEDYDVDLQGETPTELQFSLNLVEGSNKIIISAVSVDGTEESKELTYSYGESST